MKKPPLRAFGLRFGGQAALLLLPLLIAGCSLTHQPLTVDPVHLKIRWHESFEAAEKAALESNRPVLVCFIAGIIDNKC